MTVLCFSLYALEAQIHRFLILVILNNGSWNLSCKCWNGGTIAMSTAIHIYLIDRIDRKHDNQAMIRT